MAFRILKITALKATGLETSPIKIKIVLLLSLPDPMSLRAFVGASPLCHELYRSQRLLFLSPPLFNCLSYNRLHIALTILESSIILQEVENQDSDNKEDLIFRKQRLRHRLPKNSPSPLLFLPQVKWQRDNMKFCYVSTELIVQFSALLSNLPS